MAISSGTSRTENTTGGPSAALVVTANFRVAGRLCRGALRLFAQRRKPGGIVDRQIGEDLAIQFDAGLLQTIDEHAVAQPVQLSGSADAHDPDGAILALLLLAAAVGELKSAFYRLFC